MKIRYFYHRAVRHLVPYAAVGCLACASASSAWAQTPEQLFRGILGGMQSQKSPNQAPAPADTTPQNVAIPTKDALLEAARNGRLLRLGRANYDDQKKVVDSVHHILVLEYGVPPLSRDCLSAGGFQSDVWIPIRAISNAALTSMSDQPPEFANPQGADPAEVSALRERMDRLRSPQPRTLCDGSEMGRVVPNPYKAALVSLIQDYYKATQEA